jgi:hypothetical protein
MFFKPTYTPILRYGSCPQEPPEYPSWLARSPTDCRKNTCEVRIATIKFPHCCLPSVSSMSDSQRQTLDCTAAAAAAAAAEGRVQNRLALDLQGSVQNCQTFGFAQPTCLQPLRSRQDSSCVSVSKVVRVRFVERRGTFRVLEHR